MTPGVQNFESDNAPLAIEVQHDAWRHGFRLDDLRVGKADVECIDVWIVKSLQRFHLRSKNAVIR